MNKTTKLNFMFLLLTLKNNITFFIFTCIQLRNSFVPIWHLYNLRVYPPLLNTAYNIKNQVNGCVDVRDGAFNAILSRKSTLNF